MSTSLSEEPTVGLSSFFDYLWGNEEGYVYLPTKDPKTSDWKKVMFKWPIHKEQVIVHSLASNAEGKDVFCSPVLFIEARPIKENVKGSFTVWADFDGNAPRDWATENQQEPTGAAQEPTAPPPSLRIQSSVEGHEHVFWKLEEFVTDIGFIENTNRSIAYAYRADTSGWDVNQVLRPPGTTNYKVDRNKEIVSIIETNESLYTKEDFTRLKPVKQLVSESLDLEEIPDVTWVVSKYQWDEEHYTLYMQKSIPEGRRSSALMKIGFFGAELGMSDAEIYSLLINADDRWGKFKNRTDRKKRLLDIINKARQKHPVGLSTPEGLLRSATDTNILKDTKYLFGFQEFLDTEIKIEWVFEDLLEEGGIGVISAQPGIGKTQMSIQLAICAALGIPFLKWKPLKKMKIIFFSLEMAHAPLKHFIQNIAQGYSESDRETLERNLKIVPLGEPLPFDRPEGKKFIEALFEEYKPDGIIVDSMGKVTNSTLNDEEKIKELNTYYVRLRNRYNCFLWFIHHNRKPNGDNKKPRDLSDLYGNQYIAAETTVVLVLWKDKTTGRLELITVKCRLAPELPPFEIVRDDNLKFSIPAIPVVQGLMTHISNEDIDDGKDNSRGTNKSIFPGF